MAAIWKFELEITDRPTVEMPYGAEILHVGFQNNILCVWAMVTPTNDTELRYFRIIGTGRQFIVSDVKDHLATVFDGDFVWHIFESND